MVSASTLEKTVVLLLLLLLLLSQSNCPLGHTICATGDGR
jgi:hypothetical protein